MDKKIEAKTFGELSREELYEILKVRMDVFIVEQECHYHDIDGMDIEALHVFLKEGGNITAYLRIIDKDPEENMMQIGRVLTMKRGKGLGRVVLKEGIKIARERMHAKKIYIEAQVYAKGFYEKEGFIVSSDEFLEDGIPHVQMMLEF